MKPSPAQIESIAKYRKCAASYDQTCGPTQHIRLKAIDRLRLQAGEAVLDVGCGTGLSFAPLLERVGSTGHVLAFEQSPEMYALAFARIQQNGWQNVHLALCDAEHYCPPDSIGAPDAVLMHYVHDVCRSPFAIANLFRQFGPSTRISVAGMKNFSGALSVLNRWAYYKNKPYNAFAHDMNAPWDLLEKYVPGLQITPTQWGMGFIAYGSTAV